MAYSEPWAVTEARRRKAAEAFPVLADTDPGTAIQIDNWEGTQTPVTDFTAAATRIGRVAAAVDPDVEAFDPSTPDTAPNVTFSWREVAQNPQFDPRDPYGIRAPYQGAPADAYAASSSVGETLGNLGGLAGYLLSAPAGAVSGALSGENPRESVRGAWEGLNNPRFSQFRDIGFVRNMSDEDVLPFDLSARDVAGGLAGIALDPLNKLALGKTAGSQVLGGSMRVEAGEAAVRGARNLAGGASRGAGMFDQFITPAVLPDEASQIGRVPGTDPAWTAGVLGEEVGPTGNVTEMLLGREPRVGENVNARRYFTNLGRSQQAALAADEQAAFRSASERAIAGAMPDDARGIGGGAMRAAGDEPTVTLYRGDESQVKNLSLTRSRDLNTQGRGLYFTTSARTAAGHADIRGTGGVVSSISVPESVISRTYPSDRPLPDELLRRFTDDPVLGRLIRSAPANPSYEDLLSGTRALGGSKMQTALRRAMGDAGYTGVRTPYADGTSYVFWDEQAIQRLQRGLPLKPPMTPMGGGADLTPDEFARLAAKKAAGEALNDDEITSLMNAAGRSMGAMTDDEIKAAREALYNGPVPTDMREVDTGLIEGVRSRLGAPTGRSVEDALKAARSSVDEPTVTVYRGVAKSDMRPIEPGAPVTLTREAADSFARNRWGDANAKIIEAQVPVSSLQPHPETGLVAPQRIYQPVEDALSRARQAELSPDEAARQARVAARDAKFERFRAGLRRMNEPSTGAALSKEPAKLAAAARELNGTLDDDLVTLMARFDTQGPTLDNRNRADQLFRRVTGGAEEADAQIRAVNSSSDLRAQFDRFRARFPERAQKPEAPTPPAAAADDPFARFDAPPVRPGELPEARRSAPNVEFLARMREQANRRAAERAAREGGIGGGADVPGQAPLTPRNEFGLTPEQVAVARNVENAQRAAQGLPPVGEPSRQTMRQIASRVASEAASFPMAAASTYDASAPGRQLAPFLYGHPTRIIPTLKAQFGGMKTANFEARQAELAAKPYAKLREIAKVELADVGQDMSKREEQIASTFAEKVLPKSKNFNQGYTLAINEARDWLFKSMLDQVDPALLTPEGLRGGGQKELERIGSLVNASTGRGSDLGGILRQNKIAGIPAFWAPRMLTGRVQLVTALASESPIVRKEAARQLLAFVAVNTALLTMAAKSGVADVELDPRSSDFGQMRIGQRRYDLWAGYRPLVNLVTRLGYGIAGQPNMKTVDKGDRDGTLYSKDNVAVIARFLRTKLSPIAGEGTSQVVGRDLGNQDVKESRGGRVGHAAYQLVTPSLFLRSLVEEMSETVPRGFAEGGPSGAAMEAGKSLIGNAPYFLGTGGGYYEDSPTGGGSGGGRPSRPTRPQRPTRPTR